MASKKRTGGAPRKAPGGLNRALYIRCDEALLAHLERIRVSRSKHQKVTLSQADVVRQLIRGTYI